MTENEALRWAESCGFGVSLEHRAGWTATAWDGSGVAATATGRRLVDALYALRDAVEALHSGADAA